MMAPPILLYDFIQNDTKSYNKIGGKSYLLAIFGKN